MKRMISTALLASVLLCAPLNCRANTYYMPSAYSTAVGLVPMDATTLLIYGSSNVCGYNFASDAAFAQDFAMDGTIYNSMNAESARIPFVAFFSGPEGRYYAIRKTRQGYQLYQGKEEGSVISMSVVCPLHLPWPDGNLRPEDCLACKEGVVLQNGDDLYCLNPATGEEIMWQDSGFTQVRSSGETLLAQRSAENGFKLAVLDIRTQTAEVLAELEAEADQFAISPDGQTLAWLKDGVVTFRREWMPDRRVMLIGEGLAAGTLCCLTDGDVFAVAVMGKVYLDQAGTVE